MPRRRAPPNPAPLAKAPRAPREASLVVLYGLELGRRVPLPQSTFTIGRSTRADLFIDEEAVSRNHARISCDVGTHTILDLGSSNGVFVNEKPVTERKLEDGDRIRIGRTLIAFLSGENVEARHQEELHRLMTTDPITSAHNPRYFHEALEREHGRATSEGRPLSLLLFDVDGFDRTHSALGPTATDAALRRLHAAVKVALRPEDILGRLGQASFGVILPETSAAMARKAAEDVRVAALDVRVAGEGVAESWTVSLGVATMPKGAGEGGADALLATAQAALAEATAAGGNRVGASG